MKRGFLYTGLAMMLISGACSDETELQKNVFIHDKDYYDLPAYSEWGYNTFGAYYDMVPLVSDYTGTPAKIINTAGRTSFYLNGHLSSGYYSAGTDAAIIFDFFSFDPQSYTDLLSLNNLTADLQSPVYAVRVKIDTATYDCDILEGSLVFTKVRNLIVDKKQVEVILSGTFGFRALVDQEPVAVTMGRFDVGIGTNNFFRY